MEQKPGCAKQAGQWLKFMLIAWVVVSLVIALIVIVSLLGPSL